MPCCHPVQSFKTGNLTENGKSEYIRCPDTAYSGYLPLTSLTRTKKRINYEKAPLAIVPGEGLCLVSPDEQPCGQCVGCRMDNAFDWKVRCCLELQYNPLCFFVTLTYDDQHLPFSKATGQPVLHYHDVQKFLYLLRAYMPYVRYYGCGEYGSEDNTRRPHYHILLWSPITIDGMVGVRKFTSSDIAKCWKFGMHVIEHVTPGNIAYVCGYVVKKQADPDWDDYEVRPFTFMSTKPAIGAQYFIDHYDSIKATKKVYAVLDESRKPQAARLPRYFKRLLDDFPWYQEWKERTKQDLEKLKELESVVYGTANRSRLGDAKEAMLYSRLEKFRRKTL